MYYYCILNHSVLDSRFFYSFSVVVLFLLLILLKLLRTFFLIPLFIFFIYFFITLAFCGSMVCFFSLIFVVVCFSYILLLLYLVFNIWNIFSILLFNFAFLFFFFSSFISSCLLVCFVCFIHQLASHWSCFLVYVLVSFVFNWSTLFSVFFVCQVTSLCFVLYELFWLSVCMQLFFLLGLILHLPLVWGSSSVSGFIFCFCVFLLIPFNAITNILRNLGSPARDRAWASGVGAASPEHWPGLVNPWSQGVLISENSHEGLPLDPRPGITQLSAAPCAGHLTQTPRKTKPQTQSSADRLPTGTPPHTTSHSPARQRKKNSPPPTRA